MAHFEVGSDPLMGHGKGPLIKRILKSFSESADSMSGPKQTFAVNPSTSLKFNLQADFKSEPKEVMAVKKRQQNVKTLKPSVGLLEVARPSRKRLESSASIDSETFAEPLSLDPTLLSQKPESEVIHTDLEGVQIAGFAIGGEIRLCLPRILKQVLGDFSPKEIFGVCESLHINLAQCTDAQLKALTRAGVLPPETARCGLITKTDSERLFRALLYQNNNTVAPEKTQLIMGKDTLPVAHECFGGCRGIVALDRYSSDGARCIQCIECRDIFAPMQFVAHCHDDPEHRACHWGFNPANWRSYLMLSEDIDARDYERMATALEGLKEKFRQQKKESIDIKQEDGVGRSHDDDLLLVKRVRLGSSSSSSCGQAAATVATAADSESSIRRAAQVVRKLRESLSSQSDCGESLRGGSVVGRELTLPPYLLTGEPVLITHSSDKSSASHVADKYRWEPGYTPNVSLDPTPYLELRSKYPDLVHENDPMQTVLRDLSGEVKGERSNRCGSFGGDDNVFRGADDDDDDDEDDDDDDDDNDDEVVDVKVEKQSVISDKITCPDEQQAAAAADEIPPTLEKMVKLVSDPDDTNLCSLSALLKRDQEAKLALLQSVLDAGDGISEVEKSKKLEKFLEIQNREKGLVKYLSNNCAKDEKELGYIERALRDKDSELAAERRRHEDDLVRLRQEHNARMREAALERCRLLQQVEALANGTNSSEIALMAAQYKDEADRLRQRLQDVEMSNSKLQQELNELRSAAETAARDRRVLALTPQTVATSPASGTSLGWYAPPGTTWFVAVKQEP